MPISGHQMNLWRVQLAKTPRMSGAERGRFCLDRSIIGIGWSVDHASSELSVTEYERLVKLKYGKLSRSTKYFVNDMRSGDLCWIRVDGLYYLARVNELEDGGGWTYENGSDYDKADLVSVRRVTLCPVVSAADVPQGVVKRFIRGQAVSLIRDESLIEFTKRLWNDRDISTSNRRRYEVAPVDMDIFALISADGCEDVVSIFIQDRGYQLIPSTCKVDKPRYEYDFVHRETGGLATAQVKNGRQDLNEADYQSYPGEVFLFTSKGQYVPAQRRSPVPENRIHCLNPEEIELYMRSNSYRMPPKIRTWLEVASRLAVTPLSRHTPPTRKLNQLNVIKPYRLDGVWLFDDERVGLVKEPFVAGADTIIEVGIARKGIANAHEGFLMLFSAEPFPGADMQLEWLREEMGGNVYRFEQREGWLCPALLRYFEMAPKRIFVQLREALE